MARRGFFAELQHQNQVAAKKREQAARASLKAQTAAQRQAEQAQRAAERAQQQAQKASAAEQKAADREAKRLHEEAMAADAAARNAELASTYDEIDSILAATLAVDDFVDLEQLRTVAEHPPFEHPELEVPVAPPPPIVAPLEPQYVEPQAPKGLGGVLGGKKKHAQQIAEAQDAHAAAHARWQAEVAELPKRQMDQLQAHQLAEQQRVDQLAEKRRLHQAECDRRDAQAADANRQLDDLIGGLQVGAESAVQDYVGIVLGNSVYPDSFPIEDDFTFDSSLKELTLTVLVPPPSAMPSVREYKYTKAKDEITATALPKGEQKERYASAVHQVALRSMHEVFEADRTGWVQTISLTVATEAIDPATGLNKRTSLVAVAAEREAFLSFDLSNIVPLATLQHLGALVSKNPFDLVGIDGSQGVRRR